MPNWRIVGPSSADTEGVSRRIDEDLNFVTTSSHSSNWNYSYRSALDELRSLSDYVIDFNGNIVDSPIFSEKNKKKDDTEMRYIKNDYFEISKDKTEIVFKTLSDHPFSVKILNKKPEYGDILFFADAFENFELNFYIFSRTRSSSEYRVICLNNRKVDIFSYSNNNIYVVEPEENLVSFYKNIFSSRAFYEGGFYSTASPKELREKLSEKYPEMANLIEGISCDFCGKKILNYYIGNFSDGKKYFCEKCAEKVHSCSRCGNYFIKRKNNECRDGAELCNDCCKYHFVTPYHRYYPKIKFFGNNHDNSVPYLGMELEVDYGGESDSKVAKVVDIFNKDENIFAYCSHDSSLNNGFEIITQPATMEYHNSIKHVYAAAMNKLKEMKYSSHNTSTCGLHIHFNRDFFGSDDTKNISKFIYITEKFWNELVTFSRRPEYCMERYAKKIAPMPITEYINKSNKKRNHDFHYYSVNITNTDTIELRTFKGTLNVNTILATLQLVNNMAVTAKYHTLSEIQNMKFEDFLTTKYQKKYWERHKILPDNEE